MGLAAAPLGLWWPGGFSGAIVAALLGALTAAYWSFAWFTSTEAVQQKCGGVLSLGSILLWAIAFLVAAGYVTQAGPADFEVPKVLGVSFATVFSVGGMLGLLLDLAARIAARGDPESPERSAS